MSTKALPKQEPKEFGTSKADPLPTIMVEAFGSGRLAILRALGHGPRRYADLARSTDASESETSRNLARLLEVGLVAKHASGEFTLTPLGGGLLALVPTLDVLATHSEAFRTHAVHSLPRPFLLRLDEVSQARAFKDPFAVLAETERVFAGVETFFFGAWILGKSGLYDGQIAMQRMLRERIEARRADARGILLPDEAKVLRGAVTDLDSYFSIRSRSSLPVSLAVSDAGAVVMFEEAPGRIDFNFALAGTDVRTRSWCRDLFLHWWGDAGPAGLKAHR